MSKKLFEDYKKAKIEYEEAKELLWENYNKFKQPLIKRLDEIIGIIKEYFPKILTEATCAIELKPEGVLVKGNFYNLSEIFIPNKYLSISDEEIKECLKNEDPDVFKNEYQTT